MANTIMIMIRAMRPTFRNPYDKVAFVVHASCLASGFVLLATGPSAFCDDPFSSAFADEVGIDQWNYYEDNYGFIYSTPEGPSKKFLIKCLVMNGKLLIDAVSEDYSAIRHLELNVQDYVENGGANYEYHYKNFGKLVEEINKEILSKGSPSNQPSSSGKGGIRDNADQSNDSYQPLGSVPSGWLFFDGTSKCAFGGSPIFPAPGPVVCPTSPIFPAPGPVFYPTSPIFPAPGPVVYPTRSIGGYEGMILGPRDAPFFPGVRRDPRLPVGSQGIPPGRFMRGPTRPARGRNYPDL